MIDGTAAHFRNTEGFAGVAALSLHAFREAGQALLGQIDRIAEAIELLHQALIGIDALTEFAEPLTLHRDLRLQFRDSGLGLRLPRLALPQLRTCFFKLLADGRTEKHEMLPHL